MTLTREGQYTIIEDLKKYNIQELYLLLEPRLLNPTANDHTQLKHKICIDDKNKFCFYYFIN